MHEALLQVLINGVVAGSILVVPTIGFTAIFAVLRYPNFAIGSLAAIGAYSGLVANVHFALPLAASLVCAFLAAAGFGLATEWLAVRPVKSGGPLMMAIASVAAGLVLENIVRFGFGNDLVGYDVPLARDITFGAYRIGPQQLDNIGMSLLLMGLMWLFLRFTATGRSMRAVADNPDLAMLRGVDPARVARITIAVAAGLAGVGGMLIGLDAAVDPLIGARLMLSIFAAAVFGGLGSIPGAVLGAFVIGMAEEMAVYSIAASYRTAVGFVIILVVLTAKPSGILGTRVS